jgi:hypothetical protein
MGEARKLNFVGANLVFAHATNRADQKRPGSLGLETRIFWSWIANRVSCRAMTSIAPTKGWLCPYACA